MSDDVTLTIGGDADGAQKAAKDAGSALEQFVKKAGAQNDELAAKLGGLGGKTEGVAGMAKALGPAFKVGFAVATAAATVAIGAVAAVSAEIIKLGQRGADVADISDQFAVLNQSIGNTADTVLSKLRTALAGTVSDFDLMKATNIALSQGLKLNADQFELVGQSARVLADRVGGDAKDAYETLTMAMATGQDKTLKGIGLNIDASAAVDRFAAALGKEASDLNESQAITAKKNAILEELQRTLKVSGQAEFDFADAVKASGVMVDNFRDALAKAIAQSPVVQAMLASFQKGLEAGFGIDQQAMVQTLIGYINKFALAIVDAALFTVKSVESMRVVWAQYAQASLGNLLQFTKGLEIVTGALAGYFELVSKIPGQSKAFRDAADATLALSNQVKASRAGFTDQIRLAKEVENGTDGFSHALKAAQDGLGRMSAAMHAARDNYVEFVGPIQAVAGATSNYTEVNKEAIQELKKAREAVAALARELSRAQADGVSFGQMLIEFGPKAIEVEKQAQRMGVAVSNSISLMANSERFRQWDELWTKLWLDANSGAQESLDSMTTRLEAFTKTISESLIKAVTLESDARKEAAQNDRALTIQQLEFKVSAAKRGYASAVEVRQLESDLSQAQLDQSIDNAQREFVEKTRALDLTTDAGKRAYAAQEQAHQLAVTKMVNDWKEGERQKLASTKGWVRTFTDVFSQIPAIVQQSLTGGGGMTGAFKGIASLFGEAGFGKLFESGGGLYKAVSGGFTKLFGSTVGGALSAALPGIGAALGSLIGPALHGLGKLFGVGINDEIKKFNKEIFESQTQLIATYGGLERIDRLGKIVGVDLAGAWRSQGEAGKKQFDALAKDFEAAVSKMQSDLDGFRTDLDGAFGEAKELGYIFDKDGKLVSVSFDKMQEKASEFGVDLNALGPAFNGQKIAAEAANIVNSFELLSKGGADAGTILFGMKDEISKLVQEAIKAGVALPAQMRPWIQNLIDTHQLLDENGQEITDIGKIKFGDAIETQFEAIGKKILDLIAKIDHLVTVLESQLTPALDTATRDRTVHVGWSVDDPPLVLTGDDSNYHAEVEPHAKGGVFSRPHIGLVAEGGRAEMIGDVDFMTQALSGALVRIGEINRSVSSASAAMPMPSMFSSPSAAGAAPGGQTIVEHYMPVTFEIHSFDADGVQKAVEEKIYPAIRDMWGRGRGVSDTQKNLGIRR